MISPPLSPAQAVWLSCVLKAAAGTSVPNDGEKSPMYSPRVFFFFFFGTKRERDKKDLKREIRHSLDLIVCCGKREREERRSRGEKLRPGSDTFRSNPPPSFKVFFFLSPSFSLPRLRFLTEPRTWRVLVTPGSFSDSSVVMRDLKRRHSRPWNYPSN